jgi:hypothetical protein
MTSVTKTSGGLADVVEGGFSHEAKTVKKKNPARQMGILFFIPFIVRADGRL